MNLNGKAFLTYVGLPIATIAAMWKLFNRRNRVDFHGKVVMITGASSGLGEALAHEFYSMGSKVVLSARREDELNRVKQDLLNKKIMNIPYHISEHERHKIVTFFEEGIPVADIARRVGVTNHETFTPIVVPLDLAKRDELASAVDKVLKTFGQIDILIHNGGISHRGYILQTSIEVDTKLMDVNYFGPVALTKAVLPSMVSKRSGHIVFVSSVQGLIAIPHRSAYGAAKHAMQAFSDSLRAEMNEHGINVSIVSPGYIKTAISLNAMTASGDKHGVMDPSTNSGFPPEYVAEKIVKMVKEKKKEMIVSQFIPMLAIQIRYWLPSLYFSIMAQRARKPLSA